MALRNPPDAPHQGRTRRLSDRFGEAASGAADMEELSGILIGAAGALGFSYVALLHHASLADPDSGHIRIDNYPRDWALELARRIANDGDPVHQASRRSSASFEWSELSSLVPLSEPQRAILRECQEFGIGSGFTVPINVPGEPSASCSFAMRSGSSLPVERLTCAEAIGLRAFASARKLCGVRRKRPHLSRRELQCLRFVAEGKTDPEIALILGISTETVRQYVKRARSAYDVVSRTQLAILALRDDWISFDDLAGVP